jgi:lipopolysaccharide/colanic/teichoic acid biosynthesis glycosyltransferase/glycosyltransferase involved in cell wall biosynthesis
MYRSPDYLFLKQCGMVRSYFGEICLDVPRPGTSAIVYSEIRHDPIGGVRFVTAPQYDRSSFIGRVISWVKYLAGALGFSLNVTGRPILFIIAQPPFLPLLGYVHKKLFGRRYVVWVDDVYPDVLVRRGIISAHGWADRAWSAFNRVAFGNAEHVFTLSPNMLATVRRYLPHGFPATIVPTWVDTEIVYPVPKHENAWSAQQGLNDKKVVMYSGNFGETHDLDALLDAARRLRARRDLVFVLIGTGTKWEALRSSVAAGEDPNVRVLPWQPSKILHESLSAADMAYVTLAEGIEGISMPSKTYYAMAAGSALLASCTDHSDLAHIVRGCECGIIIKPGSVDDLVRAIEDLCDHPSRLDIYKANARTAAIERYSRSINGKILRETLECIVRNYTSEQHFHSLGPPKHHPNDTYSMPSVDESRPAQCEVLGRSRQCGWNTAVKRSVDGSVAFVGLVVLSPVLAAAALLIRLKMGGPVLFRQQRPGLHERPFTLLKFRTMLEDRDENGALLPDDLRLTSLGRFLRATSIDELPQLWNVLRGNISLVGPRPLLMSYLSRYSPEQSRRHEVMPGITGWAQINGRNALSWEEKFTLDVWYVDHWSLSLDLKILWLTVRKVLRREGINQHGQATMTEFLGSQTQSLPHG